MNDNATTVQSDETAAKTDFDGFYLGRPYGVMTREEAIQELAAEAQEGLAQLQKAAAPKPKAPKVKPRFYDVKDKKGNVVSPRRYGPRASGFDQRQLAAFNKGRFAKPQVVKCDAYLGEDGNKIPVGRLDMRQALINHDLGYWE